MEHTKISLEMRVMILVVVVAVMIIPAIRPSSAQEEAEDAACWLRISNCLGNSESSSDVLGCCPIIQDEIDNERECFCLMKDNLLQNASLASSMSTILTFCGITRTFDSLCPGSPTKLSPIPSPSETTITPSPLGPSLTPTITTPTSSPPGAGVCWERMRNCTKNASSTSSDEILPCCPLIKQEIANERECFCAAKPLLIQDPSVAKGLSQIMTLCSITSSFDDLCPGSTSSPTDESSFEPPVVPSMPSNETLPPTSPDANNNSSSGSTSISGSTKKIAYSVGIFPSSIFIISVLGLYLNLI